MTSTQLPATPRAELPPDFDMDGAEWIHYDGSPQFDYPIDYSIAIVDADVASGRIDFLGRWAPNAYCHYHRHLGTTLAAVIDGEQHIIETHDRETITKVRTVGFVGQVPDGETHMEHAGADGMTMLFSVHCPDGRLFEVLDKNGEVLVTATIEEFVSQR